MGNGIAGLRIQNKIIQNKIIPNNINKKNTKKREDKLVKKYIHEIINYKFLDNITLNTINNLSYENRLKILFLYNNILNSIIEILLESEDDIEENIILKKI